MTDFVKVDDKIQALNIYYMYDTQGRIIFSKIMLSTYKVVNGKAITNAPAEIQDGKYKLKYTYYVFNKNLKIIGRLMKLIQYKSNLSTPYNLIDMGIVYDPFSKAPESKIFTMDYFVTYNKPVFNTVELFIYTNVNAGDNYKNNVFVISPEKNPDLGFPYILNFFPSISVMEQPYVKYESIQRTCPPATQETIKEYKNVSNLEECLKKEFGPNYYPDEIKKRTYFVLFEEKNPYRPMENKFLQIYFYTIITIFVIFLLGLIRSN